jgi:ketosteroid isomerase-like protein
VFTPPNEPQITGNDNIKKFVDGMLEQNTATARYTNSTVDVAGDWAIERYVGELTLTPKKGSAAVTEHLRGIHIYRRQPDGSWRIAQDIWNTEPEGATRRGS